MKEIICYSKKYGNKIAFVNDEDYIEVNKHRWNILNNNNTNKFYASDRINNKLILMHQFILGKSEKGFVIDNIDGNGLNNCRSNLRFCTFQQNAQNRKGTNKYKGVGKEIQV